MDYIRGDFLKLNDSCELMSRGIETVSFLSVDSTQSAARRHATVGGYAPVLFLADTQTKGRGRLGRSFYSPSGTGLYMTLMIDVTSDEPADVARITSAVAVAVAVAAERVTEIECKIKWVNDIYIGERKACGILAESFLVGEKRYVAIGIGLNVSTADFPKELSQIACSFGDGGMKDVRRALAIEIATSVSDAYESVKRGDTSYMDEYRKRSAVLGKNIIFKRDGAEREGYATSIDDCGGLNVISDGEYLTLKGGEISVSLKKL